jgi:glycosyltransferase involved in cell wall biosynthesis
LIKVLSIVLNNFKNDSRVLKENISLQNAGYHVKVVALHEEPLKEFEKVQCIPVHRVKLKTRAWSKYPLVQLIKYLEFIYRVIKKYRKTDILHCNDLNTLPAGVFAKMFNRKLKLVYDSHEYAINDTPYESKISIWLKYFIERILIQFADKVITVSNSIANEYKRLYNIPKPSLILNCPRYHEQQKKDIFRNEFNIRSDQNIFLYQGGLSHGRGIEILLETFKIIDDDNSVIVFMGYGPLEGLIKESSKEYENIYFHPAVPPDELLDFTSSADFGISTIEDSCLSYRYCLPNKMFEYLMAEIPVIVSNLIEMRRLVENNRIGIVAKSNTLAGLQEAITEALQLDKKILQKSIQIVKNIYNWEEQEKVLLNLYKDLYAN